MTTSSWRLPLLIVLVALAGWFHAAGTAYALEPIKISRDDVALDLSGAVQIYRNQGANFQVSTAPGPEGIRLLCNSPVLARLHRLAFASNHLNRALTAELAACAEVSNLRVLDLSSNWVGNDGAAAIARSPHFAGLLALDLSYAQVGDDGIEAILESPLADGLVLLDLRGSPASDEMKEVLRARMGDRVRT